MPTTPDSYGFVFLHRNVKYHEIFKEAVLFQTFVFLLTSARYKRETIVWDGEPLTLNPGQLVTTNNQIAAGIHATRDQVRWRLERLVNLKSITTTSLGKSTLITIQNWEKWQTGKSLDCTDSYTDPCTNSAQPSAQTNDCESEGYNKLRTAFRTNSAQPSAQPSALIKEGIKEGSKEKYPPTPLQGGEATAPSLKDVEKNHPPFEQCLAFIQKAAPHFSQLAVRTAYDALEESCKGGQWVDRNGRMTRDWRTLLMYRVADFDRLMTSGESTSQNKTAERMALQKKIEIMRARSLEHPGAPGACVDENVNCRERPAYRLLEKEIRALEDELLKL